MTDKIELNLSEFKKDFNKYILVFLFNIIIFLLIGFYLFNNQNSNLNYYKNLIVIEYQEKKIEKENKLRFYNNIVENLNVNQTIRTRLLGQITSLNEPRYIFKYNIYFDNLKNLIKKKIVNNYHRKNYINNLIFSKNVNIDSKKTENEIENYFVINFHSKNDLSEKIKKDIENHIDKNKQSAINGILQDIENTRMDSKRLLNVLDNLEFPQKEKSIMNAHKKLFSDQKVDLLKKDVINFFDNKMKISVVYNVDYIQKTKKLMGFILSSIIISLFISFFICYIIYFIKKFIIFK